MKKETSSRPSLRYKEWESPVLHIEQVSKNTGEHNQLQCLVETFYGTSCSVVGYPPVETTNMVKNFNVFCRNIWREEAKKSVKNTGLYTRAGP